MKKIYLLSIFVVLFLSKLNAQVSAYTFAASASTYTAIAGGTVIKDGTTATDDWVSGALTIPSFTFNCVAYTTAYATSNGQLTLGAAAPSTTNYNAISTTQGSGITICPFSADLDRVNTTTATEIRQQTVGSEVVFQWKQFKRFGQTESFDFQARLNTTTGEVRFFYQLNSGPGSGTTRQPEVGIRTSSTDYNNRKVGTGAETWAASLAGTANTDVCRFTSTATAKAFTSGQMYSWTSTSCSGTPTGGTASASVTSATCSTNSTLSLSGNTSSCGISYQWQSSSDNSTFSNIGGATSSSYAATAITATTYYKCVLTCSNGGATGTSTTATVTINAPVGGTTVASSNPACPSVTFTLSLSGNTSSGVGYQWQSSTDGSSWSPISGATSSTYAASQTSSTYYMCTITCTTGGATVNSSSLQVTSPASPGVATLPYSDNFSSSCADWNLVNGSQTNKWVQGSVTGNPANCMYISNDNGTTNFYTNSISTVHFYKDITFPSTPNCFTLTFDFKGNGEAGYDNMKIFLVPTSTTPVAGTALATGQIGATEYSMQSSFQNYSVLIPASAAGTTMRLVFSWTNDGGTRTQPPAAVDNVSIVASASSAPSCATLTSPANAASNLCPTSVPISWTAPAQTLCNALTGYKLYLGTDAGATNISNGVDIGIVTSYTLTGLSSSTTYYWSIVPFNTTVGSATGCTIRSFTTGSFTADNTAPINDNFSAICLDWTTVNGSQPNQWFLGSATGNTGSSVYISNDNGTSNAYTITSSSTVHFYKDIDFPAGLSCVTLSFDWKNVGETGLYDYISVYLAPTSVTPAAGSLPSSTYQIGTNYYNQSAWQTVTITLPASVAGTTQRLIFSWQNDGSAGTQPPGAIDNIIVSATAPPIPNCASGFSPANAATGICPVGATLTWAAPSGTCQNITGYKLYFGTDAAATNIINGTNIGNVLTYSLPTLSGSTVYYWKIVPVNATGDATGCTIINFTTSASPSSTACSAAMGAGVSTVTLPYTLASGTTNGAGNNLTSANVVSCGSSNYYSGEDLVYVFTPTASGAITASVTITGTTADAGMSLYEGCPLSAGGCGMSAGTCIGYSQSLDGGTRTINACVQAGVTYYLILDAYTTPVNYNFTNLSITAPTGAVVNDDPCSAINLPIGTSCSYTTYSNQCATSSSGIPAPGCANYQGGDVWFKVTIPSSGAVTIDTDDLVMLDGGMAAYSSTSCSALTLLACDDDNSANGTMPTLSLTSLTAGSVVYIRVWEAGNNNNGTFGICVTNPCPSGSPSNDVCTSATALTLGTTTTGNNNCTGSIGEPSRPSCWTTGTMNTVWYTFVAPASGQVKIRTIAGTLSTTQIEVLSGTCGSMTSVGCNDDAVSCGGTTNTLSLLSLTGLTSGTTYYVRVDGTSNTTGSFAIIAIDGSQSFPGSANQDCIEPGPVCNQVISVGNPGYQSYGANCDLPTSYCLASGERNVVWYRIPIITTGTLTFNIVPNDYTGTYGSETDYDFGLWKIDAAVTCATIAAGSSTPVSCNYDSDGVTGLAASGNAPTPYSSSYNLAYEPPVAVTAGEVYLLAISNYSNSTSGFQIDFNSSAPIDYTAAPTTVAWTGGTSTAYNVNSNWGGCAYPTCSINAEVTPSSTNQPNITSAISPQQVKDLMINPGSTLTLGPNSILQVCGNFTNLGNLVCDPTSTVVFNGTGTQTVSGDLTGINKFGHFTVTKASGSVVLASHVDVAGDFTTSSNTSVFNIGAYILTVAGNFTNSSAGTTFTNVTGSTVIFNGTAAQTYSPGGALVLNSVTMNHSGTGVTITTTGTPNMIIGTSGILTLTNGHIITPGTQEVEIRNTANAATSSGNTGSFVEGNLRRYLAAGATGSFDFPVGHATKGYQLANVNFTTAAAAGAIQLLARFDTWGGTWTQPGAPGWGPECTATYNQPYLDNGCWSIDNVSGTSTGTYNVTLYNTNYTNAAAGWSVAKSPSGGPAWALSGTCVASPVTAVVRTGLSGFSKFATIQSSTVLPLQLLSFKGVNKTIFNELKWESVMEDNLNRYELESSIDGHNFKGINSVIANGSMKLSTKYSFNDYNFFTPITYYRLNSIDNNGDHRYSSIIAIENNQRTQTVVKIFPNPATSEVNISMEIPFETDLTIEVKDILGRIISSRSVRVEQGMQTINYSTFGLSEGTYIISTSIDNLPTTNNQLIITK